jgi:hypothetical protein
MADLFRNIYLTILLILGIYSMFTLFKNTFYIKLYAIVTLGVEIIGFFYLRIYQTPIAWLYNLYAIFEIWAWANFFLIIVNKNRNRRFWLLFFIYTLLFIFFANFNIMKLNNEGFLLNNVIVASFIAYYFNNILKNGLNISGFFWIMIGAMFYNVGGFLLTGMVQIIAKTDPIMGGKLFDINTLLNIFFYGLVLYGVLNIDRECKELSAKL